MSVDSLRKRQVKIRQVATIEECRIVHNIASEVWGEGAACSDAQLSVHAKYGGVVLLAYDEESPVGFLFSFPSKYNGEFVLWSHETAVLPGYQDSGVGRALKEFQRTCARDLGYRRIGWTYDPLVSRNAYFNLVKLGAKVAEYKENAYGVDEGDLVNQGLETDRFIVTWDVFQSSLTVAGDGDSIISSVAKPGHCILGFTEDGPKVLVGRVPSEHPIETQIPLNFSAIITRNPMLAKHWRQAFRVAAQELLADGFRPVSYAISEHLGFGSYLWEKTEGRYEN